MNEIQKRDSALSRYETWPNSKWLEEARKKARHFVYTNSGFTIYRIPNVITSDDVRTLMNIETQPDSKCNNIMGMVFRAKGWCKIGELSSKAKNGHGRLVKIWTLKDYMDKIRGHIFQGSPIGLEDCNFRFLRS